MIEDTKYILSAGPLYIRDQSYVFILPADLTPHLNTSHSTDTMVNTNFRLSSVKFLGLS